ncbi:hypothetical protein [Hymenobacter sp. GOD-10R]|uniref:hypothetical protein n=1 Tax=Hymenobacter sp. GOD-10R TaxID=3093922 RepID=UPI002D797FF1|nr:hypothetical protein [Hymenobacter sp. GOD-10R]WRQ30467.1 hypothetical protein SD425_09360 [Hymenobacter sp. GOD-10R]
MKNLLFLLTLLIALGTILYLYRQLSTTEQALKLAEKRFADCEQVTFQLQMQKQGITPRGSQNAAADSLSGE